MTTRRGWPLIVRRARPDDGAAVLAFSTTTWDGWDYMPRAWPRWLEETDGVMLVGVVGKPSGDAPTVDADGNDLAQGSVVCIVRVAMPAVGEAWLEGIRVDPRVRGMDVATDLQVAELHWAAANGAHIVRYATSARNEGSHRLGARGGLEQIAEFFGVSWKLPTNSSDEATHGEERSGFDRTIQADARGRRRALLSALDVEGAIAHAELGVHGKLWSLISGDATFEAGARLYEPRPWAMEELTEEKFRQHLSMGEVIVERTAGGNEAVAILVANIPPAETADLEFALIVGEPRAVFELVDRARQLAGATIDFRYPSASPLGEVRQAYLDAGYQLSDWALHILARRIDAAHPLPEVEGDAVILEDSPQAVITPPR